MLHWRGEVRGGVEEVCVDLWERDWEDLPAWCGRCIGLVWRLRRREAFGDEEGKQLMLHELDASSLLEMRNPMLALRHGWSQECREQSTILG